MNFVVIDPGKHTGITTWEDTQLVSAMVPMTFGGVGGIVHMLTRQLHHIDFAICEEFVGFSNTRDEKGAIEIIGFIKGWCEYQGIPLKMQAPAVRKGYVPFAKAYPGVEHIPADIRIHAYDSIAHALRYLHKEVKLWSPPNATLTF